MFKVLDRRPAKIGVGMIIREYINGEFTREFVFTLKEQIIKNDCDKDVEWHIVGISEQPYVADFFKNVDFIKTGE